MKINEFLLDTLNCMSQKQKTFINADSKATLPQFNYKIKHLQRDSV